MAAVALSSHDLLDVIRDLATGGHDCPGRMLLEVDDSWDGTIVRCRGCRSIVWRGA